MAILWINSWWITWIGRQFSCHTERPGAVPQAGKHYEYSKYSTNYHWHWWRSNLSKRIPLPNMEDIWCWMQCVCHITCMCLQKEVHTSFASYNTPLNTWYNNSVVITSKRRHFDVIMSKWRRFDVIRRHYWVMCLLGLVLLEPAY